MLKAIIFDFDYTLGDSTKGIALSINYALEQLGHQSRGLLWTIEQMGIDRDGVLYVGDSLVDAKTAENAKVKFAAVLTGTTTKDEFANYDHVLIAEDILDVYQKITNILR